VKHQELFFKQWEGTVQQEFVPTDQTITQQYYSEVYFAMCEAASLQKKSGTTVKAPSYFPWQYADTYCILSAEIFGH
jgi:hypothetical protein